MICQTDESCPSLSLVLCAKFPLSHMLRAAAGWLQEESVPCSSAAQREGTYLPWLSSSVGYRAGQRQQAQPGHHPWPITALGRG